MDCDYIPIFSQDYFPYPFSKYPHFRNLFDFSGRNTFSTSYIDCTKYCVELLSHDTVTMKHKNDGSVYSLTVQSGNFAIDFTSSEKNESYRDILSLYRNSIENFDDPVYTITKVQPTKTFGSSKFAVKFKETLIGISVRDILIHHKNNTTLTPEEIKIVDKIVNNDKAVDPQNVFAFMLKNQFIVTANSRNSINDISTQMIYFYCRYEYEIDILFSALINLVNKCRFNLLYYLMNDSFPVEEKEIINYDTPRKIIDCLKDEMEIIKKSSSTDVEYLEACRELISIYNKFKKRSKELYPSPTTIVLESPTIFNGCDINGSKHSLLKAINIFNIFDIAFLSWVVGESLNFRSFYFDILRKYLIYSEHLKCPHSYQKKSFFTVKKTKIDGDYKNTYPSSILKKTKKYRRMMRSEMTA